MLESRCEKNVELCTNGVCTCDAGYIPQDCCDCAPGYYKDKIDDTCKRNEDFIASISL